ncbi:hypothetical protein [Streptomyces sp. NPDC003247]|uniref:hypothetical protein n=1 Tax=Streptomyces sp. NPDC003247 TaxID=3364677 RepID=UPI00368368E6
MDAAVAGLVGALGGGFLGAAGAWGAAVIAFRGARYQADRQGETAHEQWLRQIRRDAYTSFITPARTVLEQHLRAYAARRQQDWDEMEAALRPDDAFREMTRAFGAVELEAPTEVTDAAEKLRDYLTLALHRARHWPRTRPGEDIESQLAALDRAMAELLDLCRDSLHRS